MSKKKKKKKFEVTMWELQSKTGFPRQSVTKYLRLILVLM